MSRYTDRHFRPRQRNRLAAEIRAMIEGQERRELPALSLMTRGETVIIDGDDTIVTPLEWSAWTAVVAGRMVDINLGEVVGDAGDYIVYAISRSIAGSGRIRRIRSWAEPRTLHLDSYDKVGGELIVRIINNGQQDYEVRACYVG